MALVSVVAVPDAGGVADVVTDHSYPVAPVAAVQLTLADVLVIMLAVSPVTGGQAPGESVVNGMVTHAEKPEPQLVRT